MSKDNNTLTLKHIHMDGTSILFIKELGNYLSVAPGVLSWDEKKASQTELLSLIHSIAPDQVDKYHRLLKSLHHSQQQATPAEYTSYTLCMHPSRRCNLSCKYCFATENPDLVKGEIDIETAKAAVDFMVHRWAVNSKKFTVDIAGSGEPLLKFGFIQELSEYCRKLQSETGKEIKIMFPSNGALLTPKMADYFSKTPNILLGFSLDGNMRQNANRCNRDGSMAFDASVRGIKLIRDRKYGIAVTVTHINEDVDMLYDYLIHTFENVDAISMQVVRDYSDSEVSFYNIDADNLIGHYKKLVDRFFAEFEQGNYSYINPLLLGADTFGSYFLRALSRGVLHKYRCGAGRSIITVGDQGELYACSVENGNKDYLIGNIYEGIDENRVKQFSLPNTQQSEKCKNCWAAYICGGECFVTAKKTNDRFYEPNDRVCQFRRRLIALSIYFAQTLQEKYDEAYRYVTTFGRKRLFFESVIDSSAWAVSNYLKQKNIAFEHFEMERILSVGDYGTPPGRVNGVIKRYDHDFDFYEVDRPDSFCDLKLPAIAFMNKKSNMFYEYVLIKGYHDGRIVLMTNAGDKEIELDARDFLQRFSSVVGF